MSMQVVKTTSPVMLTTAFTSSTSSSESDESVVARTGAVSRTTMSVNDDSDGLDHLAPVKASKNISSDIEQQASTVDESRKSALPPIQKEISFPGKGATFECTKPWGPGLNFSRYMRLESVIQDSLIDAVEVFGHEDGKITISLYAKSPQKDDFETYFQQFKLHCIEDDGVKRGERVCVSSQKKKGIEDIFKCLADHNEIPLKQLVFLRYLTKLHDWKTTETEVKRIESDKDYYTKDDGENCNLIKLVAIDKRTEVAEILKKRNLFFETPYEAKQYVSGDPDNRYAFFAGYQGRLMSFVKSWNDRDVQEVNIDDFKDLDSLLADLNIQLAEQVRARKEHMATNQPSFYNNVCLLL